MILDELTMAGLHDYLEQTALQKYASAGHLAIDLGAGTGALALRLKNLGLHVTAVGFEPETFQADVPFVVLDLNEPDFASVLGESKFDLVTSVEVIEHLESPISFLRNVRRLLKPTGVAVLTTPNVDNVPARLKFFLSGRIRMMDDQGNKTHISPIFLDLLQDRLLPRAGMVIRERFVYPPEGFLLTRQTFAWIARSVASLLPGKAKLGDCHIFVLQSLG